MPGTIFNIQHFSVQDGPGIRSTVFFKGCPLECVWCHNPESHFPSPEIACYPDKCIDCGNCVSECPQMLHAISNGKHSFIRKGCANCGKCVIQCYAGALEIIGKEVTAEQIISDVLQDRIFYNNTNGGITISGGEPMMQPKFAIELARLAKENGLHVCLETSGYCSSDYLLEIARYTDLFLYDYKISDETLHEKYTGVSNNIIIENLLLLDKNGSKTVLRCPIISDINLNSAHFKGIATLANSLKNIQYINILLYHPLGISKKQQLGKTLTYTNAEFLKEDEVRMYIEEIRDSVNVPIKIN